MLIFITFCFIILIQLFFYLFLFGKFSFAKTVNKSYQSLPVSVIICAKNEEQNLKHFLPFIAEQNYSNFEIVLVDDGSTDGSLNMMNKFKTKFSSKVNIQILSIEKEESKGKKSALNFGIQAAKNEFLLLTDADCKPISKNWINEMVTNFSKEKTIVLGYGAYRKINNSLLNKIIRFETLLTAIQYFSYAKIGKAYMGVGRNVAYKKEEFLNVNGFKDHEQILSGDDDLLINQITTKKNTEICYTRNSFTISEPETNFNKWMQQKRRHVTTSNHYKLFHQILLSLFYVSQLLFWILSIYLIVFDIKPYFTIFLILFRFIIWYLVIKNSAIKLNEKDLIRFSPIYEISIIFIQLYIFFKNIISPPKEW